MKGFWLKPIEMAVRPIIKRRFRISIYQLIFMDKTRLEFTSIIGVYPICFDGKWCMEKLWAVIGSDGRDCNWAPAHDRPRMIIMAYVFFFFPFERTYSCIGIDLKLDQ